MFKSRYQIATALALLFHTVGLAGILFFDRSFFASLVPYHLLLMCGLLIYTQKNVSIPFVFFFGVCFFGGLAAEIFGTSTGLLFGEYSYGIRGPAIRNVPLVIGLNWFLIIYCCGTTVNVVLEKLSARLAEMTASPSKAIRIMSVISDGAMLSVFFDWLMEPAAIKLGFWRWLGDGEVPFYNYVSWFVISALMLVVFAFMKFGRRNIFAVNLLLIMAMFFTLIRTFL